MLVIPRVTKHIEPHTARLLYIVLTIICGLGGVVLSLVRVKGRTQAGAFFDTAKRSFSLLADWQMRYVCLLIFYT